MGARMRFIREVWQRMSGMGRENGVWVEFWGIGRASVYSGEGEQPSCGCEEGQSIA